MKKIIASFWVGAFVAYIATTLFQPSATETRPQGHLYAPTRESMIAMQKSQFPNDGLVLFGDSITDGLLFVDPKVPVINAGIGGSTTSSYLPFAKKFLKGMQPKAVIVAIGVNNAHAGFSREAFSEQYAALCASGKETGAKVFVSTVLPVVNDAVEKKGLGSSYFDVDKIHVMNDVIREIARKNDYALIDSFASLADSEGYLPAALSTDGVHLSREGYEAWKNVLWKHVEPPLSLP